MLTQSTLFVLAALTIYATAAPAQPIDTARALSALRDARDACESDRGALWRRSLCGPIALVGPSLLLVLLGVSGQLERYRWLARSAGIIGVVLSCLCWATDWTITGVHELSSGVLYPSPGVLTPLHYSQIAIWLIVGIAIARRATGVATNSRVGA